MPFAISVSTSAAAVVMRGNSFRFTAFVFTATVDDAVFCTRFPTSLSKIP